VTKVEVSPYSLTAIEFVASDSVFASANIARKAVPTASTYSTIGPNYGPQSAIDGKMYTRWNCAAWTQSEGKESQSYQLAWNKPQTIASVKIHWGETRAINYFLDYSINGKEWKTIKEIANGSGSVDEFSFQPVKAKYLRMSGTRGSGGRWTISVYSIREFEVFSR
jgi:chondroitin AC lyase